jgi:hypothetical protein
MVHPSHKSACHRILRAFVVCRYHKDWKLVSANDNGVACELRSGLSIVLQTTAHKMNPFSFNKSEPFYAFVIASLVDLHLFSYVFVVLFSFN